MPADFPELLDQHMRRIRASASAVATEIGMSREAVNNWRRGHSKPSKKHRDKVVACSHYLRLSEAECNQLLAAVGFDHEFAWHGQVAPVEHEHLFQLLEQARPYAILMLLSQAHMDQPPQQQLVINATRQRHPDRHLLAVQLPYSKRISVTDFFTFLGKQMNLPGVQDELSFEFAMNDLLQAQAVTLVITRFEQSNDSCRDLLAGILRNLTEMHPDRMQVILCGGAQLSALKYAQGELSLLNIATAHLLEFKLDAWLQSQTEDPSSTSQSASRLQRIHQLVGNHPALASTLLQANNDEVAMEARVIHSDLLYCDFNQVMQQAHLSRLQEHLNQTQLGPYRPHIQDPVLRQLFWLNLIRKDADLQLVWQSETIRQLGLKLLAEHGL